MTMELYLDADGFNRFQRQIDAVDMEKVKQTGVKNAADELAERVRDSISDTDINSPSHLNSPYYRGHPEGKVTPGPPMSDGRAWLVEPKSSDTYEVKVHPQVRRRAVFLEYGTSGPITPNSSDKMQFYVEGVPVFAESVSGVRAQGFWRGAIAYMRSNNRLEHHVEEAFDKELREKGLI